MITIWDAEKWSGDISFICLSYPRYT